jgi:hypothetical protein
MNGHDYESPSRSDRGGGLRAIRAITFGVVAAAIVLQFAACQRWSGATLRERASQYWQLKQQKRWEEVYNEFLDPALKDALPREAFLKKRLLSFDILTFGITDSTENGDEGTVTVKAKISLLLRGGKGTTQPRLQEVTSRDSWVKRDGTWYILISE